MKRLALFPAILAAFLTHGCTRQEEIPDLGHLQSFELTDQDNQRLDMAQLRGKVWVANFIFTRCPTICPVFTRKMGEIQAATADLSSQTRLVSFSVDPDYDTPEVLAAYAEKHGANPERWHFLTGSYGQIKETVVNGLKTAMGNKSPDGDFAGIFHGSHFVVVDGQGIIRGFVDSNDSDAVRRVVALMRRLVDAPPMTSKL